MRYRALLFSLVVPVATVQGQTPTRDETAQRELTATVARVIKALQSGDTTTLGKIYAKSYRFAIGGGDSVTTLTRAERMASIAASEESISRLNVEQCRFDLYGTTAVGGCWFRQQGEGAAWTSIYTTVVFRRATPRGSWRLLASHASVNRPGPR